MMADPSIFKRAYDAVTLFALLNLLTIGGLCALLAANGAIDAEKVRRIVAVMRGDEPGQEAAPAAERPEEPAVGGEQETMDKDLATESEVGIEIMRREAERVKAELDQRLALNNNILLRVMTERERFRREVDEAAKREEASLEQRRAEGFRKQIAIYESLRPKVAVQHLLAMPEADDAAKILLEMDTRKAKKVVEMAKRGDQMEKMKTVLRRVREVAPDRSAELESSDQP